MVRISSKHEEENIIHFTMDDTNVSIANALRRTIISDIDSVVFNTFPETENNCSIHTNTSRFTNEIIKHRLSLIPIHITDLSIPIQNYLLIINKTNTSLVTEFVTTEHFQIKDKTTDKFLSKADRDIIFPKNAQTNHFIQFLRLRPKLASNIAGESIILSCTFSISNAKHNSAYNQTSSCFYKNTLDPVAANDAWTKKEKILRDSSSSKLNPDNIAYEKKNWFLLDALRYFTPDSFDFRIKSVGVFNNTELIHSGCNVLMKSFTDIKNAVEIDDTSAIVFNTSITTIENCYDITLHNCDYTVGKVLEYFIYSNHYNGDKILSFCGFIKEHPHDLHSMLRIAFKNKTDQNVAKQLVIESAIESINTFTQIDKQFTPLKK